MQPGIYAETEEGKFPDDNLCRRCEKWIIEKKEIEQLVDVPFEDITVKIPGGYDAILTRCYGDYMKLPDEKDRVNHMPVEIQFPEKRYDIWKMKRKHLSEYR